MDYNGNKRFERVQRNEGNMTTFFFSHFPRNYSEYDMWKVFRHWGEVAQVYIAKRLDKWGHRFGFVRFLEVRNVIRLQRQLDSIMIGHTKLYVNLPRYGNEYKKRNQVKEVKNYNYGSSQTRLNKQPVKVTEWRKKTDQRTYVQVARDMANGSHQVQNEKGINVNVEEAEVKWLLGSYIGRVKNYEKIDIVKEEIIRGGMGRMNAKYMGDNLLLIQGNEEKEVGKFIEENKEWWDANFDQIKPWSPTEIAQYKITWVRCRGMPFSLWSKSCFSKVIDQIGTLVSVDEKTLSWECLEYARLKVRVPNGNRLWMQKHMTINGVVYNIVIEEETHGVVHDCNCYVNESSGSSESSALNGLLREQSSVSDWSEMESQGGHACKNEKEERTIQSPRTNEKQRETSVGMESRYIRNQEGNKVQNIEVFNGKEVHKTRLSATGTIYTTNVEDNYVRNPNSRGEEEREAHKTTVVADSSGSPKYNQMTLINEAYIDPTEFMEKRRFWDGESSKSKKHITNEKQCQGSEAEKRKNIRSVVRTIFESLSNDGIQKDKEKSGTSSLGCVESAKLWEMAKQIGVKFSGEEEQIIKEIEGMEIRDRQLEERNRKGKENDHNENN